MPAGTGMKSLTRPLLLSRAINIFDSPESAFKVDDLPILFLSRSIFGAYEGVFQSLLSFKHQLVHFSLIHRYSFAVEAQAYII
jgi:hypothetical protein